MTETDVTATKLAAAEAELTELRAHLAEVRGSLEKYPDVRLAQALLSKQGTINDLRGQSARLTAELAAANAIIAQVREIHRLVPAVDYPDDLTGERDQVWRAPDGHVIFVPADATYTATEPGWTRLWMAAPTEVPGG